ncbi:MAG: transposase [Candidatus Nealsonbacteria bacterium]|nr:transposase [Candidatus Nealsonbacteria bacterium]
MNKIFEYKLRPNKKQVKLLDSLLWETKCLYNNALQELIDYYEKTGKYLNRFTQDKNYNKQIYPNIPAQFVDTTLDRLHRSFANFFRGLKQGKKIGFPRFQSYKRWSSFAFRDYTQGKIKDGKWYISKTNGIKVIQHRDFLGTPKLTRLVKRADGYYIQVICEIKSVKVKKTDKQIGLDLGLRYFIADSSGNKIEAPKFFRKAQYKLARNQRQLSKKQKEGKNRNKVRQIVVKNHLTIQRQRRGWLHKLSHKYANENDVVVVENLNVAGMVRNRYLSLSISDASWATFLSMLEYKLQILSRTFIKVNPVYTSQKCSQCGAIVQKSLSQRTHYCPECLYIGDRDVNAAKNILKLGQVLPFGEDTAIAGLTTQEANRSLGV